MGLRLEDFARPLETQRRQLTGSPAAVLTGRVVVSDSGCWEWQGRPGNHGYGRIKVARKDLLAHRYVYEQLVGPIPDGLVIDHLCRNTICVNPAHLEPVTQFENVVIRAGKSPRKPVEPRPPQTHCIRGHESCRRLRQTEWRQRQRGAA